MTYTTNQLIAGAYYAAGVVSREFATVSGSQLDDALGWANDILAEKRVDQGMIPYETAFAFKAETGREIYFIPDLIEIDTLVFYLDSVRYAMQYDKRNQYFGIPRVENVQTLPYDWYFERVTGGGNLYIYFFPDRNYPMEVHGKFGLKSIKLGQDLSASNVTADLGVPTFYFNQQFQLNAVVGGEVVLAPGQLVISTLGVGTTNVYDLQGTYQNIGALINYINSGIVQGVNARLDVNNFVLYSVTEPPTPFYVQSNGYTPSGTRFIGNVQRVSTANIAGTYNNGILGEDATITALAPNTILVIDAGFITLGQRVLLKDQTNPIQNGCYIMTQEQDVGIPWIITRTTNYDTADDIRQGDLFTAEEGDVNFPLTFVQTSEVSMVGVSPIRFQPFGAITFPNFSTVQQFNYQVFNPIGFDQFYITYLRYALADRICAEYNYVTPPNVLRQLGKYESWINQKSRLADLRMQKQSTLQKRNTYGWAFINLGRGWISNG